MLKPFIMFQIFILLILLFEIRNWYTFLVSNKATEIISKYANTLIENREYDSFKDYYSEMKVSYNEYLFSFWKFGVKQYIKKEYRDVLEKYIKE